MAFQGSLKELPLPDVIQLVAVSGKTGAFWIEDGDEQGKIFLRDGKIVHAETTELVGEEAVYELATWTDAHFRFETEDRPEEQTIERSNTGLLLEAARRIDEWRVLAKKVPSTRMIPRLTNADTSAAVSLSSSEERVVDAIDGEKTLEAIARDLDESSFDIAKVIYDLINAGVVRLERNAS